MSNEQIVVEAMALPLSERVSLAQTLWQSIDAGLPDVTTNEAVPEAIARDDELAAGVVRSRAHEEVMWAAIGCLIHPIAGATGR